MSSTRKCIHARHPRTSEKYLDAVMKADRNEEPPGEEMKRKLTTKCEEMAKGEDRAKCSGGGKVKQISTKGNNVIPIV